ncbi:MAG TPA: flavoprotein [Bdellovibrionales bacterium]|nr:flavoprotein [Bdellovibrionales bacterium]
MTTSRSKILFQLTGSIACYKACQVISRLVQNGFEVQTVCTASALQFVGPATLEGLTGRPVFSDVYEHGRMMDHIQLAKWAELAIVAPASANTINSLAAGLAQDAVGALFLAYDLKKPYLIAPAMNSQMLAHPATQASLSKLRAWGVNVLETDSGNLACGDVGEGRLLEPEKIFASIQAAAARFV